MEAVTSTRSCRAAIARCISELSANTLRQLVDGQDTQLGSVTQLFRSLLDTAQPPPAGTDEGAEEEEQQVRLFPVHSATPSRHVGCFAAAEHRVPSQAEATTKRGSKAAKTGAQKRSKDISDAEGARGELTGLPLQAARQPIFKTALRLSRNLQPCAPETAAHHVCTPCQNQVLIRPRSGRLSSAVWLPAEQSTHRPQSHALVSSACCRYVMRPVVPHHSLKATPHMAPQPDSSDLVQQLHRTWHHSLIVAIWFSSN